MGQDQDDVVMIPFTTAERKVLGVAAPTVATPQTRCIRISNPFGIAPRLTGFVNAIFVQATRRDDVQKAIDEVTETLVRAASHPGRRDHDFNVRNLSQIAKSRKAAARSWRCCSRRSRRSRCWSAASAS